jgi:hypothetical protein
LEGADRDLPSLFEHLKMVLEKARGAHYYVCAPRASRIRKYIVEINLPARCKIDVPFRQVRFLQRKSPAFAPGFALREEKPNLPESYADFAPGGQVEFPLCISLFGRRGARAGGAETEGVVAHEPADAPAASGASGRC